MMVFIQMIWGLKNTLSFVHDQIKADMLSKSSKDRG